MITKHTATWNQSNYQVIGVVDVQEWYKNHRLDLPLAFKEGVVVAIWTDWGGEGLDKDLEAKMILGMFNKESDAVIFLNSKLESIGSKNRVKIKPKIVGLICNHHNEFKEYLKEYDHKIIGGSRGENQDGTTQFHYITKENYYRIRGYRFDEMYYLNHVAVNQMMEERILSVLKPGVKIKPWLG